MQIFLQLIKEWPPTLYQVSTIVSAVIDRMDRDRNNKPLLQALAELYVTMVTWSSQSGPRCTVRYHGYKD